MIRIEQVTDLERELSRKPAEAGRRAAIIDEAHLMNVKAANAFLKTLEEPPVETYILLVSESKEAMLPTVISRCHEVVFSSLGRKEIEDYLVKSEGLDAGEAERLARLSSGIFGRALSWAREPGLASYWNRGVDLAASSRRMSLLGILEESGEIREMLAGAQTSSPSQERELEDYLKAMDKRGGERLKKKWQEREKRETSRTRRQAALDLFDGMGSFYRDIMLLNLIEEEGGDQSVVPLLNLEWREEIEREALHISARESMRRLGVLQRARKALEANVDLGLVMDLTLLEFREVER